MKNIIVVENWRETYKSLEVEDLQNIIKKFWGISKINKSKRNDRNFLIDFIESYLERANKKGEAFRNHEFKK